MRVDSTQLIQSAVPAATAPRQGATGKPAFGAALAQAVTNAAATTPEAKAGTGTGAATGLAPTATTPAAETKARAKVPAGEQYAKVAGHRYDEIVAGPRNGMFINRSGNKRDGEAFVRVERGDRVFHIYGTGKNRLIVGMRVHSAPAAGTPGTQPAGTPATQPAPAAGTPAGTAPHAVGGGTSAT
jgi:hypothetical protein